MYEKKNSADYKKMIAVGQLSLIIGILGIRVLGGLILIHISGIDNTLIHGFIEGLTLLFVGLSLFYTAEGLFLNKKCTVKIK